MARNSLGQSSPHLGYTPSLRHPWEAARVSIDSKHPSPAHIEIRMSKEIRQLLRQAAAIEGVDLASFVLEAALEEARKVLAQHETIVLTNAGMAALAEVLTNPRQPTQAMRDLMTLPDLPTRKS